MNPLHIGSTLEETTQGLVVQLRRFLVLEESRKPNLAMRRLPEQWKAHHGFRPLLAESFSDPQTDQGTISIASNWTPLVFTKGFKRHRADFYQDDEHPKKLWIKTLHPKARQLLASPGELPEVHAKGVSQATAGARCALKCEQLRSLSDAFENVPDPRDPLKYRHRLRAMLTLVVHGLLCGAPDVKTIWRRAGPLNEQQRRAAGLTRRDKSGRMAMPGYDAINDVINAISPFPHARQVLSCTRIYTSKNGGEDKTETRYFFTSIEPGKRTHKQSARTIREHCSIENLNHWKHDSAMWREDRSPLRCAKGAKNLALLRNAALAILPFAQHDSLNAAFDHYRDNRGKSLKLIKNARPLPE